MSQGKKEAMTSWAKSRLLHVSGLLKPPKSHQALGSLTKRDNSIRTSVCMRTSNERRRRSLVFKKICLSTSLKNLRKTSKNEWQALKLLPTLAKEKSSEGETLNLKKVELLKSLIAVNRHFTVGARRVKSGSNWLWEKINDTTSIWHKCKATVSSRSSRNIVARSNKSTRFADYGHSRSLTSEQATKSVFKD